MEYMLLYNSYVKSVMENGMFVYFPRYVKGKVTMKRLQYKGVRVAIGCRNSTPTNIIMIQEAGVMRLEERAGYLARNY